MTNEKIVYILRGFSGKGKTKLAVDLLEGNKYKGLALSADDCPGIYRGQIYQAQRQKDAHNWCFQTFKDAIASGTTPIILHNTFVREWEYKRYLVHGNENGYTVKIVNVEETYLPNGQTTQSTHNIPDSVIQDRLMNWEPVHPIPVHVSRQDIADTMNYIYANPHHKPLVIADKDGTTTLNTDGATFPKNPEDFILNPDFVAGVRSLQLIDRKLTIVVASNQAGLANNRKSLEFLTKEIELTDSKLRKDGIEVEAYKCSVARTGNKYRTFCLDTNGEMGSFSCTSNHPTYKPDAGLVAWDVEVNQREVIWVIGNNDRSDGLLAKNLQELFPTRKCLYIPIEFFPAIARMHYGNT